MASGFLNFAGGLTGGLAQGVQQGANLAIQQQQMKIQKQQADASSINAFSNAIMINDPAMRKVALNRLASGVGIDANSNDGKGLIDGLVKAEDASRSQVSDLLKQAGIEGMPAAAIGDIYHNHPEVLMNLLTTVAQRKSAQAILAGLPQPDAQGNIAQPAVPANTNTTGTGDMGTGTPGAGGAVAAPSVDAGTSANGQTPAIVPPAPASAPVSASAPSPAAAPVPAPISTAPSPATAATAASLGVPFQGGTTPAPAQPAVAPQPAPAPAPVGATAPSVHMGTTADGQNVSWNPNNTPYVKAINGIIDKLSVSPGNNTEVINLMKDRRDQWIAGQTASRKDFFDQQNLAVAKGNLSVAQGGLALRQNEFEFTKATNLRDFAFKTRTDLRDFNFKTFQDSRDFQLKATADALDRDIANKHITIDQANQILNQKRQDLEQQKFEEEPRSPLARAQFAGQHGQGAAGGTVAGTPPAAPPSTGAPQSWTTGAQVPTPTDAIGKPLSTIGTDNKDGTFTINDQSIASSVDLGKDNRLIYDTKKGGFFIQTPTPMSYSTNENIDQARTAVTSTQAGLDTTDALLKSIDASPSSYGTVGNVKGRVQTIAGELKDITTMFNVPSVLKSIGLDKLPYDPLSPTLDGVSEVLKAAVTRALASSSNSGLSSAYSTTAKGVDQLTDLGDGSSADVKAHLQIIRQILARAHDDAASHLPTNSGVAPAGQTTVQPAAPSTPTTGADKATEQLSKQPPKPRKDWEALTPEERTGYVGSIWDMSPSKYPMLSGHTSHLSRIPKGAILNLKLNLQKYTDPSQQSAIHRQFNSLYGNGADASTGYPQ